ncbi:MAG: hypothetical protein RBJ76_03140 [Stenomitos frigidus ULC029]
MGIVQHEPLRLPMEAGSQPGTPAVLCSQSLRIDAEAVKFGLGLVYPFSKLQMNVTATNDCAIAC